MNFDFTKTLINGIKFWTKEYVQDEIAKIDVSGGCECAEADPMVALTEVGFVNPVVNKNNIIYTDKNGAIFSL